MVSLSTHYLEVQKKISQSQGQRKPLLIAVSKHQPLEAIYELYQLGQRDFGENYAQELIEKAQILKKRGCQEIRWHFIGHLQTNKVKLLLPYIHSIHTIDSLKLAAVVHKQWLQLNKSHRIPVFVEVNMDAEPSKSGIHPDALIPFVTSLSELPSLDIQGLMCIPTPNEDPRPKFKRLGKLELQCRPHTQGKLSMGMSDDFDIAIEEGATHIRVGTALFGPR